MTRVPAISLLLLILLLPVMAACGNGASSTSTPNGGAAATAPPNDLLSVRGLVLEVESGDILDLESLALEDEAGNELHFVGEGFVGETPSHLRQHALLGQPVTVHYRAAEDGTLIAVRVDD